MPWREAIITVLRDEGAPMHYADITQAIIADKYRESVGATPAATVSATLADLTRGGSRSRVVKVERGVYALRDASRRQLSERRSETADQAERDAEEMGLINAFGMFWDRHQVSWEGKPIRLLGMQHVGSRLVDFAGQAGVYVLYDIHRAIYVGRVTEQRLGQRLFEHTRGRLSSRWDRFSWFGVRRVRDDGELTAMPTAGIGVQTLIATMEALLIEGLEPSQNRRQGDFNAVEFMQHTTR